MKKKSILLLLLILVLNFSTCQDDNLAELIFTEYNFVTVTATFPLENATGVLRNTPLSYTFSQAIDASTFTTAFSLTEPAGTVDLSNYTITWSANQQTVTFTPNGGFLLTGDVIHNVRITTDLRSTTGNPMSADYVAAFVTGPIADTVPPNLLTVTLNPATDNLIGIAAIAGQTVFPVVSIRFTFDDTMVRSTVQNSFSMTAGGVTQTPSAIAWSPLTVMDDTVEFFFTGVPQNSAIVVNLTAGALDDGGNPVTNPVSNLNFANGSVSGADLYESNDTVGTAYPATASSPPPLTANGTQLSANISALNDDWYEVNLTAGSTYNFRLENIPVVTYDIELYNIGGAGPALASSTLGGTTNEFFTYTPGVTGTYYVRVYSTGATSGANYSLYVDPVVPDLFEVDNSAPPPPLNQLTLPATATGHTLHIPTDEDYFQFTDPSNLSYTIQLTGVPAGADYSFQVLDNLLNPVTYSSGGGNLNGVGTNETAVFIATAGVYYVRVYSVSGSSTASYNLSVSSATGVDYTFTGNNVPGATTGGTPTTGYTFTLQNVGGSAGGQTLTWEIYLSINGATIDPSDTLIGLGTSTGLASGASIPCTSTVGTWPTSTGIYNIIARVTVSDDVNTGNDVSNPSTNVTYFTAPVISPTTITLPGTTNTYFTASGGSGGPYTYSIFSGGGSIGANGYFTAPVTGTSTVRVTDTVTGQFVNATVTTTAAPELLQTLDNAGNGQNGIMFNITATNALTIYRFATHAATTSSVPVRIYYRTDGTLPQTSGGWINAGTVNTTFQGSGVLTEIPNTLNISIPAGSTYGFYVTRTDGGSIRYTNASFGSFSNLDMSLNAQGYGMAYPFSTSFFPRIFNGRVYYTVP